MKNRFNGFCALSAIILLCTAGGAIPSTSPATSAAKVVDGKKFGQEVEGLQLEMSTHESAISFGVPLILNVDLINHRSDAYRFMNGEKFPYEIEISRSDGTKVPPTLWGIKELSKLPYYPSSQLCILEKGERAHFFSDSINRRFDMSLDGDYKIIVRGRVTAVDDARLLKDIYSNAIKVYVGDKRLK